MNALHVKHDQPEIEIYTKDNCPYCIQAKDWFTNHGFSYTENKLYNEEQRLAFFQKFPTARTVPQIIIDGKNIGGYEQLMKMTDT